MIPYDVRRISNMIPYDFRCKTINKLRAAAPPLRGRKKLRAAPPHVFTAVQ